ARGSGRARQGRARCRNDPGGHGKDATAESRRERGGDDDRCTVGHIRPGGDGARGRSLETELRANGRKEQPIGEAGKAIADGDEGGPGCDQSQRATTVERALAEEGRCHWGG